MRKVSLVVSFTTLLALSSVGCKTASQLAWWKTADKSAVESSVMARSAPKLPSEVAMQAEGLAGSGTRQVASEAPPFGAGEAPAFQPSQVAATSTTPTHLAATTASNPSAYPTTGAAGFTTPMANKPAKMAMASKHDPNLGSIALPYNPSAVPPVAEKIASMTAPAVQDANRYGRSAPTNRKPVNVQPALSGSGTRNTMAGGSGTRNAVAHTPPRSNNTLSSNITTSNITTSNLATIPATPTVGDRYGRVSPAVSTLSTTNLPTTSDRYASPVVAAQAGATPKAAMDNVVTTATVPYRPGGTSSYPTTDSQQLPISMASKPASTPNGQATGSPLPGFNGLTPPPTPIYRR